VATKSKLAGISGQPSAAGASKVPDLQSIVRGGRDEGMWVKKADVADSLGVAGKCAPGEASVAQVIAVHLVICRPKRK
jgi:hypothetical protein